MGGRRLALRGFSRGYEAAGRQQLSDRRNDAVQQIVAAKRIATRDPHLRYNRSRPGWPGFPFCTRAATVNAAGTTVSNLKMSAMS